MKITNVILATAVLGVMGCQEQPEAQKAQPQPAAANPQQVQEVADQGQRYAYTMGTRIGSLLLAQEVGSLDTSAFAAGVADVLDGKELRLSKEEMAKTMQAHQEVQAAKRAEEGQAALKRGQAFLDENAKKPGIEVTASGLQYEIVRAGEGESPKGTDKVKVHYRGTLVDGSQFDSSYDRGEPVTFGMNGVIPGFSEAISLMKPGGKSKAYIPSSLGYGERGAGNSIGPNETLIFEIELLEINPGAGAE